VRVIFPAALMTANHSLMTALVVVLGLTGNPALAADVGLVQGAALAIFYAFSANARQLILGAASERTASGYWKARMVLALPLGAAVVLLSVAVSGVAFSLALALVARRISEWLAEVAISELERQGKSTRVPACMILDLVIWILIGVSFLGHAAFSLPLLWIWAVVPLMYCVLAARSLMPGRKIVERKLGILPHIGSTAVVGITVYVFRLLIVLLTGKDAGGDLIAAFAIGSLAGTVFGSVIGPSLLLHDSRNASSLVRRGAGYIAIALIIISCLTAALSGFSEGQYLPFRKSPEFWVATTLSLLGGAIMVVAQSFRVRLLQRPDSEGCFGADVMANVLVVATVPILFYLLGREAIGGAYLATSIGALLVYGAAVIEERLSVGMRRFREALLPILYFLMLFPLFLQAQTGVFNDWAMVYDTGGMISRLPVPLSVAACFAGLVLLGRFEGARFAFGLVFFAFAAMLVAGTIATTGDQQAQQGKLILTAQFILPMFALAFGQMVGGSSESLIRVARSFLLVVLLIAPLQLIVSWASDSPALRPDMGAFSIYQHLQYVPVILVSAYVFCVYSLSDGSDFERKAIIFLAPIMGLYAAASGSMLAAAALIMGLFTKVPTAAGGRQRHLAIILAIIAAVTLIAYKELADPSRYLGAKVVNAGSGDVVVVNLAERIPIWRYYFEEATSTHKHALIGHLKQPERTHIPSAHNYYLDLLYNFGLLGLIPVFVAVLLTAAYCVRNVRLLLGNPPLAGLLFVVAFTVLLDNFFKVGLRQPYPGMFSFFMWGLLIGQIGIAGAALTESKSHRA
jgi:hypothetical protein